MGQRLNLEIKYDGKVLANSYYHWSAYTKDSYNITVKCLKYIQDNPMEDKLLLAVRALESTGAGLTDSVDKSSDYDFMCEKYKDLSFNKAKDRNEGLIGVLDKSIEDTQFWAEGTSVIDLSTGKISFHVFFGGEFSSLDDYLKDLWIDSEDEKKEIISRITEANYDLDNLDLIQLGEIVKLTCDEEKILHLPNGFYVSAIM